MTNPPTISSGGYMPVDASAAVEHNRQTIEQIRNLVEADEKDSTGTSLPESLLETENDLYEEQKKSGQLEMKLKVAIEALRRISGGGCMLCAFVKCTHLVARKALEKIGE